MITIFDEPITVLRYAAETVGADGLPARPPPTVVPMAATVEKGTKRIVTDEGARYLRGIQVLAFFEIRAGDEEPGARLPADRIQWRGRTYEVVHVDYADAFAGHPEKWEAFAQLVSSWAQP